MHGFRSLALSFDLGAARLGVFILLLGGATAGTAAPVEQGGHPAGAHPVPVVARVGTEAIRADEYRQAYAQAVRAKFYHGSVPEAELKKHAHETLRALIDERLYAREIARRGLKADEAAVQAEIDGYERQYANSPQWQQNKGRLLPGLRERLGKKYALERLKSVVMEVKPATEQQARDYYRQHLDLFTEPERLRLSSILLGVDPSSPESVWQAVDAEGQRIHEEIRGGGSFAELARLHSSAPSAERGGDMGYLHQGMLTAQAMALVDKLAIGETSPPFRALEGVMMLRLDERVAPRVRDYADVAGRARELWLRDRREAAWESFRQRLYDAATVSVDARVQPELADFPLPAPKRPGKP